MRGGRRAAAGDRSRAIANRNDSIADGAAAAPYRSSHRCRGSNSCTGADNRTGAYARSNGCANPRTHTGAHAHTGAHINPGIGSCSNP